MTTARPHPLRTPVLAVLLAGLLLLTLVGPAVQADSGPAAEESPNLLGNPGFEEGAAPDTLAHWAPWSASSAQLFTTATDPVSEGTKSLRLTDPSAEKGGGLISAPMSVDPDVVYEVGLDAYVTSGWFSIIVYFYDAAGEQVSAKQQAVRVGFDAWQRVELDFYAPPAAGSAAVMVYAPIGSTTDTWIDNMHFGFATPDEPGEPGEDPRVAAVLAENADVRHLGQPVQTRDGSMPAVGQQDGRWVSYQVFKGEPNTESPGTLTVTDIETGELLQTRPMQTVSNAYGIVTATDGRVYMATAGDTHLWVYNPETKQVRDIGKVGTSTAIFGITPGPDGTVYIGGYPEARVYQYDPTTDMINDLGLVSATEPYARSVAYDHETDELFVGVGGQKASIWRWTEGGHGELTRITDETNAPGLESESMLVAMSVVNGRIFARTKNVALFVMQPNGTVDHWNKGEKAVYGYRFFAHPTDPDLVLYGFAGDLYYYDIEAKTKRVAYEGVAGYLGDMVWVDVPGDDPEWPGMTIYGTDVDGVIRLNLSSGSKETHEVGFGQPTVIQSIFRGPDDTMWASGFGGGLAQVSLDGTEQFPTLAQGQFESAIVRQDKIIIASYGNARVNEFDPTKPTQAARLLFDGHAEGQDRPMTMAYNQERDELYVGAIAGYGLNQGGFAVYDFATGEHRWFTDDLVLRQSVISVLYNPNDGLVYIGTTLDGGLASDPTDATEAKIIVWDPVTRQPVREFVPVAGKEGVTGLVVGPDQKVWGIAENVLFTLNGDGTAVEYAEQIGIPEYPDRTIWKWAQLHVSPIDGNVYGTVRNRLFMINGETKEYTTLLNGTGKYAELNARGDVFFEGLGSHVFTYVVPQPITDVTAEQKCLAVRATTEGRALDLSGLSGRGEAGKKVVQRIVDGVKAGHGEELESAYCS
ncbi:carbohydrate binding domain-containing protein [Microlunatus sp. Y2014]|uniref:carbohydrate binding domain-containing protein n=1 Tax=Microlunatus sp. Y2014 TaxID=3418488 RepID=UPI003DA79478